MSKTPNIVLAIVGIVMLLGALLVSGVWMFAFDNRTMQPIALLALAAIVGVLVSEGIRLLVKIR